nr:MAG TPA: hypothetical protein [Caudoviricetes sp.]
MELFKTNRQMRWLVFFMKLYNFVPLSIRHF